MNIYPLSHGFDNNAIKKFIQAADESVRTICKKIIDNTLYVSFEKTLIELNKRIEEYYKKYSRFHIENKRPVFIFNETQRYYIHKSNYWFSQYIIFKFNELFKDTGIEIISLSSDNIKNKNPILTQDDIIIFSDDCVYSGQQFSTTIYGFSTVGMLYRFYILVLYGSHQGIDRIKIEYSRGYNASISNTDSISYMMESQSKIQKLTEQRKNMNKTSNFYESPPTKLKNKYINIISITKNIIDNTDKLGSKNKNIIDKYNKERFSINTKTSDNKRYIPFVDSTYKDRLIFSKYNPIPALSDTITTDEYNILSPFYNPPGFNTFNYQTYLIYFDHKLADTVSVPTLFYLGVVPNQRNKIIIQSPNFRGFKIEKNLEVIPFIEKCKYYTKNLDLASPGCPKPPYKDDFTEIIQKMTTMGMLKTKSLPLYNSRPAKRNLRTYSSVKKQ